MSSSSSSSRISASSSSEEHKRKILEEIRSHEVAISELNNLLPSRAVYQKNGNIFFRTNIKAALAKEDAEKARKQSVTLQS